MKKCFFNRRPTTPDKYRGKWFDILGKIFYIIGILIGLAILFCMFIVNVMQEIKIFKI